MAASSNVLSGAAAAQRDAARTKAEIESDYTIGKSRVKQDYGNFRSALSRALQRNVKSTGDDFAGRGIWDSGMRKGAVADLGTDYASDIGNANTSYYRELENLGRSKTKGLLGVTTGLEGNLFQSTGESLSSILQRALNDARNQVR